MVAALFALHPINVESVVWIAERKNSLSMLFFLLALGAYRWYVAKPKPVVTLSLLRLFALGLMAKPQVITFPFVLLLWDFWPLRRISFSARRSGFRAANDFRNWSGRSCRCSRWPASAPRSPWRRNGPTATKRGIRSALRLEYALVSYVQYLGRRSGRCSCRRSIRIPIRSACCKWLRASCSWRSITAGVIALRRSRPYLLVGWFFFLGTLVPMLGLAGVGYQGKQGIADRYAYLPFIGLFIMICWGVADLGRAEAHVCLQCLRRCQRRGLLALVHRSYRQLGYWQDNVTLWSHALDVTRGNFLAENNLGKALLTEGRTGGRRRAFLQSCGDLS